MAEIKLKVREEKAREVKGRAQKTTPLTEEVYEQMSYSQQVLVNLYEMYVDDLSEVAMYEGGGDRTYYVRQEDVEAIARKFKVLK